MKITVKRINNLKNYINNYFRKYIAMIANTYNPTDYVQAIMKWMTNLQEKYKFIVQEDQFMVDYINETNSELFKQLKFNFTSKEIDNLVAEANMGF